ncbi:hypothetical protein NPIL_452881 [Nephila pilipes]|uniref:Uncharacterized protein n=1 Tax=Nephila pilipes TaxID=299642 RepID=A0A8X6T432_NEPPI|nr:hypothetical protein NPIL_452881 [Nephila pilipes]
MKFLDPHHTLSWFIDVRSRNASELTTNPTCFKSHYLYRYSVTSLWQTPNVLADLLIIMPATFIPYDIDSTVWCKMDCGPRYLELSSSGTDLFFPDCARMSTYPLNIFSTCSGSSAPFYEHRV